MREINHLSIHQWLRSAIPDSQQPTSPIGFLFLKLPPPPCAVLLVFVCIPELIQKSIIRILLNLGLKLEFIFSSLNFKHNFKTIYLFNGVYILKKS